MKKAFPKDTIEDMQEWGYRVYMRVPTDSWVFVESDAGICYVEYQPMSGFNVSTRHKPSREKGTGYALSSGVSEVTPEILDSAIVTIKPVWDRDGGPIPTKYKSMEDFKKESMFNQEYTEF